MAELQNNERQAYVEEALRSAADGRKESQRFREKLTGFLAPYFEEHPDAGRDELVAEFGTPEELAKELLGVRDAKQKTSRISARPLVAAGLAVMLAAGIGFSAYQGSQWNQTLNELVADDVIESTDESLPTKAGEDSKTGVSHNGPKYNLNYDLDDSGAATAGYDQDDGTEVEVDSEGKPLDENYPVDEVYQQWYDLLPEK